MGISVKRVYKCRGNAGVTFVSLVTNEQKVSSYAIVKGINHDPFDDRNRVVCTRQDKESAIAIAQWQA